VIKKDITGIDLRKKVDHRLPLKVNKEHATLFSEETPLLTPSMSGCPMINSSRTYTQQGSNFKAEAARTLKF